MIFLILVLCVLAGLAIDRLFIAPLFRPVGRYGCKVIRY